MASTIRLERAAELRDALRETMLRGNWLDVAAWEQCRRLGRRRHHRAIVIIAWCLPALMLLARMRCALLPDLECGGWFESRGGLFLAGAVLWALVTHAAAAAEWWLCEEKYLYEKARDRGRVDGPAAQG